jgi:CBS domain-containing protein
LNNQGSDGGIASEDSLSPRRRRGVRGDSESIAREADVRGKSILRHAESPAPSVAAGAGVRKAVEVLRRAQSGALVVLDRGKLVGVLSERDLVMRVLGEGRDPETTRVSEVMTAPVEEVTSDATLDGVLRVMGARHIRHVVVVDARRRPLGLLSMRNVARARIDQAFEELRTLEEFANDSLGG